MRQNPEIGQGGQPFQNRTEGARGKLDAIRRSSRDALNKLFPQAPKLVTETAGSPIGNIEVSKDIRQRHIQNIQTDERPGVETQTQTKPVEPGLTEQEQAALNEARRRALQEEAERAGGPAQTDMADANAGNLASKTADWIKNHPWASAGIGVSSVAGLGAIAAGLNYELNNRTEAHASISAPEGPSTFDNKADKITVGPNNTVALDQATLDTLPSFDANGKPILLFPLQLPNEASIPLAKNFAPNPFLWSEKTFNEANAAGVKNKMEIPDLPAGSVFVSPVDGYVFIGTVERNNETIPVSIALRFPSSDGSILYSFGISFEKPDTYGNIFSSLINAPVASRENSNGRDWEKGLRVTRGTELAITNVQVQDSINFFFQGGTNGTLGPDGERLPIDLQFLIDSSQKLINVGPSSVTNSQ